MSVRRAAGIACIALGIASFVAPATSAGAKGTDGTFKPKATASFFGTGFKVDPATSPAANDSDAGFLGSIVPMSRGRIMISGNWATFKGSPLHEVAILDSEGNPDSTFNTNIGTGPYLTPCQYCGAGVGGTTIQSDGKIIVFGIFESWNGVTSNRIVRLNRDGTVDTAFSANLGTGLSGCECGSSAGTTIDSALLQKDGKIVLLGDFTSLNGQTTHSIARLNADGTPDVAFNTNAGSLCTMYTQGGILLSDGRILVRSCDIPYSNGASPGINHGMLVLNTDGTRNTAWDTAVGTAFETHQIDPQTQQSYPYADPAYRSVTLTNGSILMLGSFKTFNGATSPRGVIALKQDGSLDTKVNAKLGTGFGQTADEENVWITAAYRQSDGKILVAGRIGSFNGVATGKMIRLNKDGSLDPTFKAPTMNGRVYAGAVRQTITVSPGSAQISVISEMSDGRIMLGGDILSIGTTSLSGAAILGNPSLEPVVVAATTPSTGSPARPVMFFVSMALIAIGGLLIRRTNGNVAHVDNAS